MVNGGKSWGLFGVFLWKCTGLFHFSFVSGQKRNLQVAESPEKKQSEFLGRAKNLCVLTLRPSIQCRGCRFTSCIVNLKDTSSRVCFTQQNSACGLLFSFISCLGASTFLISWLWWCQNLFRLFSKSLKTAWSQLVLRLVKIRQGHILFRQTSDPILWGGN